MADFRLPAPQQYDYAGAIGEGLAIPLKLRAMALRNQENQFALGQAKAQQAAMQQYAQTQDPKTIMPFLTPQGAMMAPGALEHQQNILDEDKINLGMKAIDYWDTSKGNLTRQSYPSWRATAVKQFPQLAHQLPEPGQFQSEEAFNEFKYQREMMAARFKQMYQQPKGYRPGTYVPGYGQVPFEPKPFETKEGGIKWLRPGEDTPDVAKKQPTAKAPSGKVDFDKWLTSKNEDLAKEGKRPLSYAEGVTEFNRAVAEPKEAAKEAHRAPGKGAAKGESLFDFAKRNKLNPSDTKTIDAWKKSKAAGGTAPTKAPAQPQRGTTQAIAPSTVQTATHRNPVKDKTGATVYVTDEDLEAIKAAQGGAGK